MALNMCSCDSIGLGLLKILTVIYLAGSFRGGTVHPVEAQDFTPVSSCSSGFSSFAGIVCSGNNVDGKVIHCIFNQDFQLGLVCVKWQRTLAGSCPRYLEEYKAIGDFPCTGGELCPDVVFLSHDVFKYPACLNRSLYITEPTTTPADTTEQPSTCRDCADGASTGSTTGTDTTTKSTLPTDSKCDLISETSKQPMSHAVPVVITVFVLMTVFCLLIVWEYHTRKWLLGVIWGCLKNGSCGHSTTGAVQVPQQETEQPAQGQLMSVQGSAAGTNHHQPV